MCRGSLLLEESLYMYVDGAGEGGVGSPPSMRMMSEEDIRPRSQGHALLGTMYELHRSFLCNIAIFNPKKMNETFLTLFFFSYLPKRSINVREIERQTSRCYIKPEGGRGC